MAEAGYSAAQAAVGHYYEKGKGVEQDYSKARTWYRKAADQGLSLPQTYLGALYLKGLGGPQDIDEAVKWFTRAAVKGWPQALLMLALMHDFGAGIPQDDIEAYRFYRVGWDYVGWDGKSKSELAQKIQKRLRIVEERMSMDEIEEGDRRVQEWEEQHPKPRYVY
ncbi:MAG: tetratricopeptide repeat protein [Sneathiella sp.]